MESILTSSFIEKTFTQARTYFSWQDKAVPLALLKEIYEVAKFGPTSANCCPLRIAFIQSPEAKEKLKSSLAPTNIDKTMSAPVTAIFAYDLTFYENLPELFPHTDAKSWYSGNEALIQETAFRNSTLQAAYFIIAARAAGLDCGPMSGFEVSKINELFFKDTPWRANFLCNLGYGRAETLHPRSPRLTFDKVCNVL